MIMLTNPEKQSLEYVCRLRPQPGPRGHSPQATSFNLHNPDSTGIFILAMRERRPFLVDKHPTRSKATLSPKSLEFARQLGSQSLICVPIVHENGGPRHPGRRQQQVQQSPCGKAT
ncbi:MAG: GAF domain-containing protein [Desulfobacterales bacterium]|nr:GAF domain-containing protein [Desulfobacterales bacterium]